MQIVKCCGSGAIVLDTSFLKRSPCRMHGRFGLPFFVKSCLVVQGQSMRRQENFVPAPESFAGGTFCVLSP